MKRYQTMILACLGIFCLAFTPAAREGMPDNICVMTFNVRFDNPDDGINAWPERRLLVKELLKRHQPDLIGLQEGLKHQITEIEQDLSGYAWTGVGRDDGQESGEYAAVFYRADRFEVIETNNFWLSETPEKPGSMGWDAACVRVVTWVKLHDNQANRTLFLFNTHFDHFGEEARQNSVSLLKKMISDITRNDAVIVTGDFNLTPDSDLYSRLTDAGQSGGLILRDTRSQTISEPVGPSWTFHGFGMTADRPRLDYIFINNKFTVNRHITIDSEFKDPYPSDHLPVMTLLSWADEAP